MILRAKQFPCARPQGIPKREFYASVVKERTIEVKDELGQVVASRVERVPLFKPIDYDKESINLDYTHFSVANQQASGVVYPAPRVFTQITLDDRSELQSTVNSDDFLIGLTQDIKDSQPSKTE